MIVWIILSRTWRRKGRGWDVGGVEGSFLVLVMLLVGAVALLLELFLRMMMMMVVGLVVMGVWNC